MAYIHQRADWPRLSWDEATLQPRLGEVRLHQGRLLGRMDALGFERRRAATLATLTSEALKTSEIEGEHLPPDQVRSSIARKLGMEAAGAPAADRQVEGLVAMLLDATQNAAAPLSEERLFGWHRGLFPGAAKIKSGRWRDDAEGPMRVISGGYGREKVHYQAPEATRLPGEMKAFLAWESSETPLDAVLKAGVAHFWFVTIHPFEDGNGRIARAVAERQLALSENAAQRFYSMSAQIRLERADYYDQLERAQKGELDITDWLLWFLGCLDRAISGAEITLETVLMKDRFWKQHAGRSLNERQRSIVNRLLDGFEGKLNSSKWATLGKCSQDTASRDIAELIELGILVKDAAGGRSTTYSLISPK